MNTDAAAISVLCIIIIVIATATFVCRHYCPGAYFFSSYEYEIITYVSIKIIVNDL